MNMESLTKLAPAFVKAQAMIEGAKKDSLNPHFKSKYADLASVVDALKAPLSENGLGYIQRVYPNDRAACVETVIIHSSGETFPCGPVEVPVSKGDAQGYGSAMTYARRYSLSAAFGVAPEDDDGNAAAKAAPSAIRPAVPDGPYNVAKDEFNSRDADKQAWLTEKFSEVLTLWHRKDVAGAVDQWAESFTTPEDQAATWALFPDSKTRSEFKKAQAERKH